MTPDDIIRAVCDVTGISEQAMFGECRMRRVARARFLCWLAMVENTGESAVCIGRFFGRDPSTISRGLSVAYGLIAENEQFRRQRDELAIALQTRRAA